MDMRIEKTVCDVCQGEDTTPYELRSKGRNKKVDLCTTHGAPLEKLFGDAKPRGRAAAKKATPAKKTATKAAKKPASRRSRITPMEEIDRLKQT